MPLRLPIVSPQVRFGGKSSCVLSRAALYLGWGSFSCEIASPGSSTQFPRSARADIRGGLSERFPVLPLPFADNSSLTLRPGLNNRVALFGLSQ